MNSEEPTENPTKELEEKLEAGQQRKGRVHMAGSKPDINSESQRRQYLGAGGYLLLLSALGLLLFAAWRIGSTEIVTPPTDGSATMWVLSAHGPFLLLVLAAMAVGAWGTRLLGAAGENPPPSPIPSQDRKLLEESIKAGNRESVQLYVVLSSLSGFTGTFQKIGFTGLPLATVLLTLIFCALHFLAQLGQGEPTPAFLELAKLTTGAFIGSFVQKGQATPSPSPTEDEVNQAMRALQEPLQ